MNETPDDQALPRPCPACGGRAHDVIFEQRFARIEGVSALDGYDVVACAGCGFCFARTLPTQGAMDAYYARATKYDDAAEPTALDRERYEANADDIVEGLGRRDASVLEVGCATGGLLEALSRRGCGRLYGREPSPVCARAARERRGLDVAVGSLLDVDPRGPFDAVVMIDVLEHVVDLPRALSSLRGSVVEGGRVVVEVPDLARPWLPPDAPYQQFSVEHVNYFTAGSLASLMAAHGFRSVRVVERERRHRLGASAEVVGVFERVGERTAPTFEPSTRRSLEAYIAESAEAEAPLRARLREVERRGEPIAVWGTGTLTLRLLATGAFGATRVERFVDGNRAYHGAALAGARVLDPSSLVDCDLPVLACSYGSGDAIARAVRSRFGGGREVLTLRP